MKEIGGTVIGYLVEINVGIHGTKKILVNDKKAAEELIYLTDSKNIGIYWDKNKEDFKINYWGQACDGPGYSSGTTLRSYFRTVGLADTVYSIVN